ncbi:MAG: YqaE/Pmp3 family membrane protein [Lentisphaerae bacterium]|nr:YqaE/Pmp3 family membrane protein [Lentisphaerota bacterium]
MGFVRAIFCILLPPLAVIDKGCGSFVIVLILTLIGWVPGIIGALIICLSKGN